MKAAFKIIMGDPNILGAGAVMLNGDIAITLGKDLHMTGAGTFASRTVAVTLNGDVAIDDENDLHMAGVGTFAPCHHLLDEADEILSRGFEDSVYDIFKTTPPALQACPVLGHHGPGDLRPDIEVQALCSNKDFRMTGAGTFASGTGAVTLNGKCRYLRNHAQE